MNVDGKAVRQKENSPTLIYGCSSCLLCVFHCRVKHFLSFFLCMYICMYVCICVCTTVYLNSEVIFNSLSRNLFEQTDDLVKEK